MVDAATGAGSPPRWVRFERAGTIGFGTWQRDAIRMFTSSTPTSQTLHLEQVRRLTPTQTTQVIALWNNFMALAAKLQRPYLIKSPNSDLNPGETIRQPPQDGKIAFTGERGNVIDQTHAPLANVCRHPLTRQITASMMSAAQSIANKLGLGFRMTLEKTHRLVRMLQTA